MAAIESIREKFHTGELEYKKAGDICHLLGVNGRGGREEVFRILRELEEQGEIVRDERGRFVTPAKLGLVLGIVQGNERGFAFLLREDGDDLFIPPRALNGALHKDVVFAKIVGGERGDEASVHSIVRRGLRRLAGTYYKEKKGGLVVPDERKYSQDIRIVGGVRAVSGEKVLVKIVNYPDGKKPEGEILEVLGRSGELSAEEDALIAAQDLPTAFPQKVLSEAARAAREPVTLAGRRDFRNELVITIDGDDSRDFDDAVSVSKSKDGKYYFLSVHIADVSHYVRRGGALDKEALSRGTSVYFPDRVLPMLPESLSNGACSLNEGEDRYTLSCLMKVDEKGNAVESELAEGVICSRNRMTYNKVTAILEGDEALRREYAHLLPMLEDMKALAEILMQKRDRRGSIDLDVREAKIVADGENIEVSAYERTISHHIIEEFMILANETVAEFLAGYELPCVYRVHEKPSEEKAAGFKAYLQELGVKADFRPENVRPGEYGKILEKLEDGELFRVVNRVMLRSMSKAKYSAENGGHFGLASRCYCHFTSPIRRYPDLVVHRLVKLAIGGQAGEAEQMAAFAARAANECSNTERRADEAERAVDELYKVWYMRSHLGEEFDAIVSGVTAFGVFAELTNTVEGLIKIENLPADDYVFVEQKFLLKGERRSFKIGDSIKIKVAACDIGTRRCEFLLAE